MIFAQPFTFPLGLISSESDHSLAMTGIVSFNVFLTGENAMRKKNRTEYSFIWIKKGIIINT